MDDCSVSAPLKILWVRLWKRMNKNLVERAGILRQRSWLRAITAIVLTTGQNRRYLNTAAVLTHRIAERYFDGFAAFVSLRISFGCAKSCDALHRSHLTMAKCL